MKCKNCDFENADNALDCVKCGSRLAEETIVLDAATRVNVDPLSFAPGEHFGDRYQIIEEIGQGGMGKVFKARDTELDITVALKMIKPHLSVDPQIVARFKRELLLAREILHEHVIRIHDLGEVAGVKYISMNYIQGNSLQEIIQTTGKLTIEKAIDVTRQVCSALAAAHDKNIIHRDLKPQNIMIDKSGKAYVLDFGIARSVTAEPDTTQEGIVLGTPDFMSPEQIKGQKVNASTDIYSLGVIMYEMVMGKLPFVAKSAAELLQKHLMEPPIPPSRIDPQVPLHLEKIILRCLEKKQKDRYQSVQEILREIEQDKTIEVSPVSQFTQPIPSKRETVKESVPFADELENEKIPGRFKYVLRFLVFFILVYIAVSVLSLVNDSSYHGKIEKLQVEYDTYYQTYFPVNKKLWLPAQWETIESNGWNIYKELFPPNTDEEGKLISRKDYLEKEPVKSILGSQEAKDFRTFDYRDAGELNSVISGYGKHFRFDRLLEAVTSTTLDPGIGGKDAQTLFPPLIRRYTDMAVLAVRLDFLEGNFNEGLDKLHRFMVFTMDIFTASTRLSERKVALDGFNKICLEMLPLLLSRDIYPEQLKPRDKDFLHAFGYLKDDPVNWGYNHDAPPVGKDSKLLPDTLQAIEKQINTALNRLTPEEIFYKEYLNLVKKFNGLHRLMGMSKTEYHVFGKFRFWSQLFSANRYFYKKGVLFYEELRKDIAKFKDIHSKNKFAAEYFEEHKADRNIFIAVVTRATNSLNAARTAAKLVPIVIAITRYGQDSKEFLNLKSEALFIDEFTGEKFQVNEDAIVLGNGATLKLDRIGYAEDHKALLQSLKPFVK